MSSYNLRGNLLKKFLKAFTSLHQLCQHHNRLNFVFDHHLKKVRNWLAEWPLRSDECRKSLEVNVVADPACVDVIAPMNWIQEDDPVHVVGNDVAIPENIHLGMDSVFFSKQPSAQFLCHILILSPLMGRVDTFLLNLTYFPSLFFFGGVGANTFLQFLIAVKSLLAHVPWIRASL